jgi:hypothetical protein
MTTEKNIPPCLPGTASGKGGTLQANPVLFAIPVIILLSLTSFAPWLEHNAPVIREIARDTLAVTLVLAAYWLLAGVLKASKYHKYVTRTAAPDWFAKYREEYPGRGERVDQQDRTPAYERPRGNHVNAEPASVMAALPRPAQAPAVVFPVQDRRPAPAKDRPAPTEVTR